MKKKIFGVIGSLLLVVGCIIWGYGCATQVMSKAVEESSPQRPTESWETTGLDMELWVIEKAPQTIPTDDTNPAEERSPQLRAVVPHQKEEIPMPLEHTDVNANISGFIATVDVLQTYHNPYEVKIEAVYVFPLPQSAAVTDFVMVLGDRKIRGIIREKEEAEKIYKEARSRGYRASILTQERPNIFKQKVANIEPGNRIDIRISYFNPLNYRDGEFEFVFPTVVGPRFNPPGNEEGIGAVGRGKPGRSAQPMEVPYLRPGEETGHDIAIRVDIDAGVILEKVYSRTHSVRVKREGETRAVVTLSPHDRIPSKDFRLHYQTAGRKVKTAWMVHRGEDCSYFSLLLQPPADLNDLPRIPREMVFVLDCSGSMSGRPLMKAKEAIKRCLLNLDERDSFQIIRFSSTASSLGPRPIPANKQNVKKGLGYLESLDSGGGTMMIEGIKAALDFPHDEGRLRIVSFMTDGYIGNESEILGEVKKRRGESRIFSFGVGSSVNRYLLERMAKIGRGAVAYVGLNEGADELVDRFYEQASRPALADIEIDWGRIEVKDVYPKQVPDLFVGRPIVITGRFWRTVPGTIRITGQAGNERRTISLPVNPNSSKAEHPGIRSVWARWKIADLTDRETYAPSDDLRDGILTTSIQYSLLSRYTAFLAIDSLDPATGDHGYTVSLPVPVPDGVKYETTVEE